ncbi:MAG: HNH endonuclease, partial [Nocardioidaceae bacterium]|nr:HNH endonuclease [Nocardioidaceae bacterium]
GIIPAVLGSKSQVLDLGRKTRLHTEAQRIALMLRDQGCRAEGCDWPPGMCHAHHGIPWSRGGGTNVRDGMLLCPRHHSLAHDRRYQMKTDSSGRVTFSRRT